MENPICTHDNLNVYQMHRDFLPQLHLLLTFQCDNLFSDKLANIGVFDVFEMWFYAYVGDAVLALNKHNLVVGTSYLTGLKKGYTASIHVAWAQQYRTPKITVPISFPIIKYFFEKHKLEKLEAFCPEDKREAMLFILRLGFKPDGRIRKHRRKKGEWITSARYSLLKEELDENISTRAN